jgi:uncharacterized protein YaaR (DUF327 family)
MYHKNPRKSDYDNITNIQELLKEIAAKIAEMSKTQEVDFRMNQERRLTDQADHRALLKQLTEAEQALQRLYLKVKGIDEKDSSLVEYLKQQEKAGLELRKQRIGM